MDHTTPGVRLDVWLDVTCLFKTRTEAQRAVTGGKVEVNGQASKPHRILHVGERLRITRPGNRKQIIVVKGVTEKHLPKADAKLLYEDQTPPPTPEELAARDFEKFLKAALPRAPLRAPARNERRRLRKVKEGEL